MEFKEQYGPWALIAGASEGLGVAFARELAARGVNLILLARQGALLETLAAGMCAEFGVETRVVVQDLTSPNVQAEVAAACDGLEVGAMIYNAGAAGGPEALIDQDPATALRTIQLNTIGQTMLAQNLRGAWLSGVREASCLSALWDASRGAKTCRCTAR